MDSRFVDLKKMGLSTTLKLAVFVNFKISQPTNISGKTEGIALNNQLLIHKLMRTSLI